MSTRWLSGAAVVLFAAAAFLFAPGDLVRAEPVNVTLVLVNDLDTIEVGETRGGFARLAGLVARERADNDHVLFVHAGDAVSPSILSGFDRGAHIVELLNMIGPDAMVPGNHEFDFGPDVFRERMSEATFPVLAANLREPNGDPVGNIADTRMFEFAGAKIGIVGVTSDQSYVKSRPGDLAISGISEALDEQAAKLRAEGADIVVALAHADRGEDEELVRGRAADLILSGDDHDLTLFYDGRTLLAESKAQAEIIVVVDLAIDVTEKDGKRTVEWWPGVRIVDTASVEPDPAVAARIAELQEELSAELDVELGTAGIELDSRRATVRTQEAAIGNLIADAMRAATGADVALTNGGGIRGDTVYPAGHKVTRRDVLAELPFGNKTVLIELSGAQIRTALENGVSAVEDAGGRFPQISGMRFEADLTQPKGSRVTMVEIAGEPLDEARAYRLATNDFMLRGGDGYAVFGEGEVVLDAVDGKLMANDVMVHVREHGTDGAAIDGRIVLK